MHQQALYAKECEHEEAMARLVEAEEAAKQELAAAEERHATLHCLPLTLSSSGV